ncbi:MAG TPA: M1 family metallopeptidase [Gemmatimonadaceae bacterium]|nr:M1 family metallopeptidase [Gemmatimonadaceae bacterium]
MSVRRAALVLLAAAGALAMPRPARAQQLPSLTGSNYEPGVDVLDYDVRLELPDTGAFLRGDVIVTARRAPSLATLRLDLAGSLRVRAVEVNGRAVRATHAAERLEIPLANATGDTVRVRVVYDGFVSDGLVVRKDSLGRWTWFGDNWPDRTRQWLPTVDHPSDKATVSWTVRAPAGRTVVANGLPLGTRRLSGRDAGRAETRWRETHPIAPYLMVIAAGPLVKYDLTPGCADAKPARCIPQSVYVMPENRAWLPGAFSSAPSILEYFESLVAPFPYEKLAHFQSSTRFGGMENATAIFYLGRLFSEQAVSDRIIAHETAHQWFGDAVTEREWAHLWLSEGLADYFEALWTRHAHGDSAFTATMRKARATILEDSVVAVRPVIDTAQTDYLELLNANSYQKGSYVAYLLHRELGDSAFFGGLRAYYTAHRDGTALTDDLRRELERSSGRSLATFFAQWLRRPGVAEPSIGWAFDASTGGVSLLVIQDSARVYAFPLTVVVTDAAGTAHRVELHIPAEPRVTLALPGELAAKPRSLGFDPDSVLLARITRL